MTAEELRKKKRELGLTNQTLAQKAGVPVSTVAKVLGGTTRSPRMDTLRALEAILFPTPADQEKASGPSIMNEPDLYGFHLAASDPLRKAPGFIETDHGTGRFSDTIHTLEDYLALPDENRVEMIDGRFYDMASPTGIHQKLTFLIWKALDNCIEKYHMPCEVQGAPFDVQLDLFTVVQPDVMVFCEKPEQALAVRADVVPDLIIEVLSRSTAFKDRHLKLFKYRNAGAKEVWLVSPDQKSVDVYLFAEGEEAPRKYSFDDDVPVHISNGKCRIHFPDLTARIRPYLTGTDE